MENLENLLEQKNNAASKKAEAEENLEKFFEDTTVPISIKAIVLLLKGQLKTFFEDDPSFVYKLENNKGAGDMEFFLSPMFGTKVMQKVTTSGGKRHDSYYGDVMIDLYEIISIENECGRAEITFPDDTELATIIYNLFYNQKGG
ncbi:MAG: hypothetical protein Q8P11_03595 [bacterium]|nr:hypothetical protein [bacterium]